MVIYVNLSDPSESEIFRESNISHDNCHFPLYILKFYHYQYLLILLNTIVFLYFLLFSLLSILSRYLAARYLNHEFKRTLIKYCIWILLQLFIVALCSSKYTIALSFILVPMLSVINWLVCLRDVRILSQVLKSSLIQMHTHLESIELYNEQLIGYKLFRIFGTILLTSSFFLTVAVVSSNIGEIVRVNSEGYCLINLIYHTHIHPLIPVSNAVHVVREIIALVTELSFSLYVLSMSIPVFAMIIISIVHRCVKRWKDKADNYRFNYDKMEPLIGKYRAY